MSRRLALLGACAALALASAAQAQTTGITADVDPARALGTTVVRTGATLTIDGGTLAGQNLFHSFNQFTLGRGETAQWTRAAGGAAAIANVISRVTGGQVSTIAGTLDSTALPNASFFFINPAGIVFGPGAQVNVPAAAHFSTAGELRFADGGKFAVATPSGSTLSVAAPEAFGFLGGQSGVAVIGGGLDRDFAPAGVALSFTGADVLFDSSLVKVRGLDAVSVGRGTAVASIATPLAAANAGLTKIADSIITVASAGDRSGALRIGGGAVLIEDSFLTVESAATASGPFIISAGNLLATGSGLNTNSLGAAAGASLTITGGVLAFEGGTTVGTDARGSGRGGSILVDGQLVRFTGAAGLDSDTSGVGRGGDLAVMAGVLEMDGGFLFSGSTGAGRGGEVSVRADRVTLREAFINSSASGAGAAGQVSIEAAELTATNASLSSSATGGGAGGDVSLSVGLIDLIDTAITTTAVMSQPGDVFLLGDRVSISGGFLGSAPAEKSDSGDVGIRGETIVELFGAQISTSSSSSGAAGSIIISAPELFAVDAGITSSTSGQGDGGAIVLQGDNIRLLDSIVETEADGVSTDKLGAVLIQSDGGLVVDKTRISSNAFGVANGGLVSLEGRNVELLAATIAADTFGAGDGGLVSVVGDSVQITNSAVSSDSLGKGKAGGVFIQGRMINADLASSISSDSLFQGDAGDVVIEGEEVTLRDRVKVTSASVQGFDGNAGSVSITARGLSVSEALISSDTSTGGRAGQILIKVDDLMISGDRVITYITSDTLGSGKAGGVTIEAKTFTVTGGAYVSSNSLSDGDAGTVDVRVSGRLTISDGSAIASDSRGLGDAGDVTVIAGTLLLEGNGFEATYISSDSFEAGAAGTVFVQADTLALSNVAFISSDTFASGEAGDVTVRANTLDATSGGFISSNSRAGAFGNAGDVTVEAGAITLDGGFIASDAFRDSAGDAGTVTVKANSVRVGGSGFISSDTVGLGDAGDVSILAGKLTVEGEGAVSSEALERSFGDAGVVNIKADELIVRETGRISTSTRSVGDAGAVFVEAGKLVIDGQGQISSASLAGATGSSDSVLITADSVSLTNGGTITTVSNNENKAGEIDIEARFLNIDGAGSSVASENLAGSVAAGATGGDAGGVFVAAGGIRIANGGRISTNTTAGAAGEISILMPEASRLTLEGARAPGSIETSSGRDTGGIITISNPLAIISNGGSILALGDRQGANVQIQSKFFINSFDRLNTVAVDGEFALDAGLDDVSSGTVNRDLTVLDASKVLRGQCPVARATGQVSQLTMRQVGPYAPEAAAPRIGAVTGGACR